MLEGKKVVLEPITRKDTEDIIRWRNQPFVRENFIYQELFTQESHEEWLETMVSTGRVRQFIIYAKEPCNGRYAIGSVYLRDIDSGSRKAEFGIFIGEEAYLGKGFGSDAAEVILTYAFEELRLHKVSLRVLNHNARAIESYKKVGFIEEGYLKDEVKAGGEYRDVILMAVFRKYKEIAKRRIKENEY